MGGEPLGGWRGRHTQTTASPTDSVQHHVVLTKSKQYATSGVWRGRGRAAGCLQSRGGAGRGGRGGGHPLVMFRRIYTLHGQPGRPGGAGRPDCCSVRYGRPGPPGLPGGLPRRPPRLTGTLYRLGPGGGRGQGWRGSGGQGGGAAASVVIDRGRGGALRGVHGRRAAAATTAATVGHLASVVWRDELVVQLRLDLDLWNTQTHTHSITGHTHTTR